MSNLSMGEIMTEQTSNPLAKLIVSAETLREQYAEIADAAMNFIRIEDKTGKIQLIEFNSLTDKQRVELFLIGRFLAHKLGFSSKSSANLSEVSTELGRKANVLVHPVKDLVTDGILLQDKMSKEYSISPHRLLETLKRIKFKGRKA